MANSAADARGTELEIRKALIETGTVDCIVSVGPNFFYTVTLPCTLWFFDKAKAATKRKGEALFIDARHIFRQIDRAHRDFTPAQIEFLANIARAWRGEAAELTQGSRDLLAEHGSSRATRTWPGSARRRRSRRSRRRVSVSIPAAIRGDGARDRGGGFPREAGGVAGGVRAADRRGARAGGRDRHKRRRPPGLSRICQPTASRAYLPQLA